MLFTRFLKFCFDLKGLTTTSLILLMTISAVCLIALKVFLTESFNQLTLLLSDSIEVDLIFCKSYFYSSFSYSIVSAADYFSLDSSSCGLELTLLSSSSRLLSFLGDSYLLWLFKS